MQPVPEGNHRSLGLGREGTPWPPLSLSVQPVNGKSSDITKTSYFTDASYGHVWASGQESSPDQ